MTDELKQILAEFLKGAPGPGDRPEMGDSYGNYDDCYYDGYRAAQYDLARKFENFVAKNAPEIFPGTHSEECWRFHGHSACAERVEFGADLFVEWAKDRKVESLMAENTRLQAVVENIRDHALANGEDCAYLDARAALSSVAEKPTPQSKSQERRFAHQIPDAKRLNREE